MLIYDEISIIILVTFTKLLSFEILQALFEMVNRRTLVLPALIVCEYILKLELLTQFRYKCDIRAFSSKLQNSFSY